MKSPAIPEFIDHSKSCDKELTFEGVVGLNRLPRFLAAQSNDAKSEASVNAKFSLRRDEQRLKIAELKFSTAARLTCQRCLKSLDVPCQGSATFVFCKDNLQIEQSPRGYEPALVTGNLVSLWQLLEDELLLSLPMFANHDDEHCNSTLSGLRANAAEQAVVSPFAVLGELLKKQ